MSNRRAMIVMFWFIVATIISGFIVVFGPHHSTQPKDGEGVQMINNPPSDYAGLPDR